ELVGEDLGLVDLPGDVVREIIRDQSLIVDFEPELALATLPKLLSAPEDRRFTFDLLGRLKGKVEANAQQIALMAEIRRVLSEESAITLPAPTQAPAIIGREVARGARHNPRTRAS
ncbi:MAG TPA: poly(3-hydroxybutyrate) depolymerase, partial [Beijerinckiaceae bacterium]|nr:poly(3-hydroxybutyrate) depolymerase [Beijerinckiaceae bacterium]